MAKTREKLLLINIKNKSMTPEIPNHSAESDSQKQLELLLHSIDFDNLDTQRKQLFDLLEFQARRAVQESGKIYGAINKYRLEAAFEGTKFIVGEQAVIDYERAREAKAGFKSKFLYRTRLFKRALLRSTNGLIYKEPGGYVVALLRQPKTTLIHELQHLIDSVYDITGFGPIGSTGHTDSLRENEAKKEINNYYLIASMITGVLGSLGALTNLESPKPVIALNLIPLLLGVINSLALHVQHLHRFKKYAHSPDEVFAEKYAIEFKEKDY